MKQHIQALITFDNFMKQKAGPEDSAILMSLLQRFFFYFYPEKADAEAV